MPFPVAAALGGATLLGGILGALGGKGKPIDPALLKRLFGPDAINEETTQLFNMLVTSPYGQNLVRQASLAGGRISQGISQRLTAAGLAGGGAETGVGSFAAAAGQEAGGLLQSQARSGLYSQALETAVQSIRDRMSAYTDSQRVEQGRPSVLSQIGGAISGAAGVALANLPEGKDKKKTDTTTDAAPAGGASSYVPQSFMLPEGTSRLGYQRQGLFRTQTPTLASSFDTRFGGRRF